MTVKGFKMKWKIFGEKKDKWNNKLSEAKNIQKWKEDINSEIYVDYNIFFYNHGKSKIIPFKPRGN